MPGMPRLKSKATKIAYKLLGKPLNLESNESPKMKEKRRRFFMAESNHSK